MPRWKQKLRDLTWSRFHRAMKAFLQHDDSGLFYQDGGAWVHEPHRARAFVSAADAEQFQRAEEIQPAHTVLRIDPTLVMRLSGRAPGVYQIGE